MNRRKMEIAIKTENLHKTYHLGKTTIEVLRGVDLEIERGLWVALLGSSGSGKTTLLNIIGGLERPDLGSVSVQGIMLEKAKKREIEYLRRKKIGIVFQAYHLIPELTTVENVLFPSLICGRSWKESIAGAELLLDSVGLGHRIHHRPMELSGGEQQRAAIARALMNDPEILLADEPTGNLDSKTGLGVLEALKALRLSGKGKTMLMVTHDNDVARMADKVIHLKDGKIAA
jgi:ABC-type lipoprotein export system ATPase subunit